MVSNSSRHTISAVIVNYNGGQEILKCIDAIYNQTFPLESIIVVDNASTDNSPSAILKNFPDINLIPLDQNYGPSKARNVGLQNSGSDLVLLIDDDVYIHHDCIEKLYNTYKKSNPAILCPRILFYSNPEMVQCDGAEAHFMGMMRLRNAYQSASSLSTRTYPVSSCISACMLVNREIALSCGGFDEAFFIYCEDLEFSIKLRSAGYIILCEPKAIAYHDPGIGTPGLSFRGQNTYPRQKVYLTIKNRLMTILIHYRLRTLIVLFPVMLFYELAMLAIVTKRGWLKSWCNAMVYILKNKDQILTKRKLIAEKRVRSDIELLNAGLLPFAAGFIKKRTELLLVYILSRISETYWYLTKHLIG